MPRADVTRRRLAELLCLWKRGLVLLAVPLILGCGTPPPITRPREGAPPIAGGTPVRLESALPPPTLAAAGALASTATPTAAPEPPPSPSPEPPVAASPVSSPGVSPIISGLQPAPGSNLPAGDVVIGARVTGSSDLVDVTAFVDGEPVPVDLEGPAIRVKTVSFVRTFGGGTHEIRIQARDQHGQLGGYRWQFSVGAPRQPVAPPTSRAPTATPAVRAVPQRTQVPIPTRIPTRPPTGGPGGIQTGGGGMVVPALPTATRSASR
jgi:hypothetical protein